MANINHQVLRQYKDQSSNQISLSETLTGNAEINLSDDALAVAANHHYLVNFTRANLVSLCISASGPVTVFTNAASGGSPTDTIVISAGQVLVWSLASDGLAKCPFSADVTAGLFVTNAGGGAVAFKVRALVNQ